MQNFYKWGFETFFGSVFNTIITLLSIIILFFFINSILGFISTSEWKVVEVNRRLLLIGRMPPEHEYRVWPILWVASYLIMASIKKAYNNVDDEVGDKMKAITGGMNIPGMI